MTSGNNDSVREKLRELGAPEHIIRAGAEGLVAKWRDFVRQVGIGYKFGLDDYRNDLDIRGMIAETGLDDRVREEDERFRGMLTGTEHEVWESDVPDAFWIRGYPRNASGELLDDLRGEGVAG